MRLTDSLKTRTGARVLVTIFVAYGLAGCASIGSTDVPNVAGVPANGPQADYPILVGEPYQIAGKQYTPADVLNYDEVGYLTLDPDTTGYSGAHHTSGAKLCRGNFAGKRTHGAGAAGAAWTDEHQPSCRPVARRDGPTGRKRRNTRSRTPRKSA